MIVVDASVAIKWFVTEEPLVDEAAQVLDEIGRDPAPCSTACDTIGGAAADQQCCVNRR